MTEDKQHPNTQDGGGTQAARRTKYGVNMAVAMAVATAIVILLNVIVDRGYRRLPGRAKGILHYDVTATRQYSLSPQTLKILGELEGEYKLINLYSTTNLRLEVQRVRDLVAEYGLYSNNITVEYIDPVYDPAKTDRLLTQILLRYEDQLAQSSKAIDKGRATLRGVVEDTKNIMPSLQQAQKDPTLGDGQLKKDITLVISHLRRLESDIEAIEAAIAFEIDQPLPAYKTAKDDYLSTFLQNKNSGILLPVIEKLKGAIKLDSTPPGVKNELLIVVEGLESASGRIGAALDVLQQAEAVDSYEQVRNAIASMNVLIVLGPRQVRVVPLNSMFRALNDEQVQLGGQPDFGFLGEELLTGALLSISMPHQPLVVFVSTGQQSPIGPRGSHEHVAHRLRVSNFEVTQWSPVPRPGPYGQPIAPGPAPTPKPGQKAVWIVLPTPPPDPQNPMAAMNNPAPQQVAATVIQRLAAGDAAMFTLGYNPTAQFGQIDPIAQLLDTWGITALQDRIIIKQMQMGDRQTRAVAQFNVDRWQDDRLVTAGLLGMRAHFGIPQYGKFVCPLVIGTMPQISHHALIELREHRMWTLSDFYSLQQIREAKFDEAESQEQYVIGVTAQRDEQRLMVVSAPGWASDGITTYGMAGPGTAEYSGAAFPGNGELFVNSVFWLAGQDQMIAATAHSQDIRRIAPISDAALTVWRWVLLAGLPAAILAIGLGVWMVRRKD
jgi:hypothetical protein